MLNFKEENIYIFEAEKLMVLLDMKFDYIVVLGGNTFSDSLYYVKKYHLDSFIKQQVADGALILIFAMKKSCLSQY